MFSAFLIEQLIFAYRYPGLQRMISFALANSAFASALIADPVGALNQVPPGIVLSLEEYQLVTAVPTSAHIAEFAMWLCTLAYIRASD